MSKQKYFLLIDYNLSRYDEVKYMLDYVRTTYSLHTILIRSEPKQYDFDLADFVIDAAPRNPRFVEQTKTKLLDLQLDIIAGIVFSDDATVAGAKLLTSLGIACDDSNLAINAFSKSAYREAESRSRLAVDNQSLYLPKFMKIHTIQDLKSFIREQQEDFIVIKPAQEGNNRGVIKLSKNSCDAEIINAFAELKPYLSDGIIAESGIPFDEEFSVDGLGDMTFITEKISVNEKYPVEYGQLLPACIDNERERKLLSAGRIANSIIGQNHGPFHNEIRIAADNSSTAIIEPNRRPGGMKIWMLAELVYGKNLFKDWIDSIIRNALKITSHYCIHIVHT
ncbi:MAG: ATP-grasp domain-containing protein, partial [Francisellaceae bacterium]